MSLSDDDDMPLAVVAAAACAKRARPAGSGPRAKRMKLNEGDRAGDRPVNAVESSSAKVSRLMKARGRNGVKSEIVPMKRVKREKVEAKAESVVVKAEDGLATLDGKREAKTKRDVKREAKREVKKEVKTEGKADRKKQANGNGTTGSGSGNEEEGYKWWDADATSKDGIKWRTLSHNAVLFPPEYEPHDVPLLYNGKEVELTAACEEVATFFAAKIGTDYESKTTFRDNFFSDFREILRGTPAHSVIKNLDKCDFRAIKQHLDKKRDEKKELSAAEKKAIREAEALKVRKYVHAIVDGREEKVGNYRVEPPGLFLGRGEHPRMGKVKSRIYPEDITINIGEEADVPEVPIPGHRWGKIVHDNKVTWLAGWKDTITNGRKYVFLSAGSAFKGMSDMQKFEKARTLGKNIEEIRRDYTTGWSSKSKEVRQRSVAMYLIDKLALRVGNEKNEDEADTVGCCSLRVEHIKFVEPRSVEFDFLGKDSMRYHNVVEVEKPVYDNLRLFTKNKDPNHDVFHRLSVAGLNEYLKSLMPGLSAKVFRTYNASVTLDSLLRGTDENGNVNDKTVFYNQQNKEVAILCNHQRSTPKSHDAQMGRMQTRIAECREWLTELQKALRKFNSAQRKGETLSNLEVVEYKNVKPEFTEEMDEKARTAERKRAAEAPRVKSKRTMTRNQVDGNITRTKERLGKLEADMTVKDDLKTVALGTSKINYLDPRITVAWCKKFDVPIEKIFASALLVKFAWAMPTPSTFEF